MRTKILIDGVEAINLRDDPYTPRATTTRNVCLEALATGVHTIQAIAETARGATGNSSMINLTIVNTEVKLSQPTQQSYYSSGGGLAPAQAQGQPLVMTMQVISGVATPARAEFYESYSDVQYARAAVASSGGLPLSATWPITPSGYRYLLGCVIDTAGIRSCSTPGPAIYFAPDNNTIRLTLNGPATAAAGAQLTYSATLSIGSNTSAQKVGLFDADTGELLAEKTTPPYDFTLSIPVTRKLIAATLSSGGYEFVSNILAVTSSNQAPTVGISRPVTGSEFPNNSTVPIVVNAAHVAESTLPVTGSA